MLRQGNRLRINFTFKILNQNTYWLTQMTA